jgi:hypothetical protein
MSAAIRLAELFFQPSPPRSWIMAVIHKGWFDDSQTDGVVCTVGGYVAENGRWENDFLPKWQETMDAHGVPYLHMTEFASPRGPYQKWLPTGDPAKEEQKRKFLNGCALVIDASGLKGFGATVRLADVDRFNRDMALQVDPFALGAYACALEIKAMYPKETVELFFDRTNNANTKLLQAERYAKTDQFYPGILDNIQFHALPKGFTFREVSPIQAADFAAYELRKSYLKVHEYYEMEDRPSDWRDIPMHFSQWCHAKFNHPLPLDRKSFIRLTTMTQIEGIVWDYRAIKIAHEARGGSWP